MAVKSINHQVFLGYVGITSMTTVFIVFVIALLFQIGREVEHLGDELAPQVDAAMEIKLEALHAHVLTEEIMGGDAAEDTAEVWQALEASREYAMALLEGGETEEGVFHASKSPEVREQIERALIEFERVWALTEARFASLDDGQGVGSDADAQFDAQYDAIVSDLADLAARYEVSRDVGFQMAIGEARYRLAHGHLITAEILGGDIGEDFTEVTDSFAAAVAALNEIGLTDFLAPFVARIEALSDLAQVRYRSTLDRTAELAQGDVVYDEAFHAFLDRADDAETMVQNFIAFELRRMERERMLGAVAFAVLAVVFVAGMTLAYRVLSRRVIARVAELTGCIERVSDGDIHADLPTWTAQDELGRLKDAIADFREALVQRQKLEEDARRAMEQSEAQADMARQATEQARAQGQRAEVAARRSAETTEHLGKVGGAISHQSQQLMEISRQITESQDHQAGLLQDIVHLVENVKDTAGGNARVATEAADFAKSATSLVEEGGNLVGKVVDQVQKISESGEKVASHVSTIEEISFQTNVLALNAAVEAARAGEAGKGFTIVAQEVRDLSQRTARAAASIVSLMEETNQYIRTGQESVETAKAQFEQISAAIGHLEANLESVGQSSAQQTGAVQQAASVVDEFKGNFEGTRALAAQCLDTGRSLSAQADEMRVVPDASGRSAEAA